MSNSTNDKETTVQKTDTRASDPRATDSHASDSQVGGPRKHVPRTKETAKQGKKAAPTRNPLLKFAIDGDEENPEERFSFKPLENETIPDLLGLSNDEPTDTDSPQRDSPNSDELRAIRLKKRVMESTESHFSFNFDSDSDSDSGRSRADQEIQKNKSVSFKLNFFDDFGEVPNLSDVSEDLESLSKFSIATAADVKEVARKDLGKFVDPLTGEVIEELSSPHEEEEEIEEEYIPEGSEEESGEIPEIEEDPDLLAVFDIVEDIPEVKEEVEEEPLSIFFESETIHKPVVAETFEDVIEHAKQERICRDIEDFVANLIENVITICEYVDPSVILRKSLNKIALVADIENRLAALEIEQKTRTFLNRKAVDYWRRKKDFRHIMGDDEHDKENEIRFRETAFKLDRLLGKEQDLKIIREVKCQQTKLEASEAAKMASDIIENFNELALKTLTHNFTNTMEERTRSLLKRMHDTRMQVSRSRLILIQRQHSVAEYYKKLEEMEDMGEGLQLRSFETLQSQTQILDKKLEEKNAELVKLHSQYHTHLHMLAHLKEKQSLVRQDTAIQRRLFDKLVIQKRAICERLYGLKMNHVQLRREERELVFKGGLMSKPALMLDFDVTNDRVKQMQAKNRQMRTKIANTLKRIKHLENILMQSKAK